MASHRIRVLVVDDSAVIRTMVADLCWPIEIKGAPTVREADGLAMSSRNQYLDGEERLRAPALYRILRETADKIRAQNQPHRDIEAEAMKFLEQSGFRPDYVSIRHAKTLQPVADGETRCVVLAAARLGKARLIDNVIV